MWSANSVLITDFFDTDVGVGAGSGQPVNGAIPSLPSPTMPTFNMAAQTPNGQPGGTEAVYTNGIPQTYPARKFMNLSRNGRLSIILILTIKLLLMDDLPQIFYRDMIRTKLTEM